MMVRTFGGGGQDLRPLPGRCQTCGLVAVTDHLVVGDRVLLHTGFRAARARLEILAADGMLLWLSEVAYGEAITGLVQLADPAAGLTRLAGVRLGDLAQTDNCAHIAIQWEAIATDGKLFAALDADLMLVPARDQITALALAGAYRPQPGRPDAELDRAIVRRCATVAIRSFLARVACALAHPAGTAEPAGRNPLARMRRDRRERPCSPDDREVV
jgi:hypothetical protein